MKSRVENYHGYKIILQRVRLLFPYMDRAAGYWHFVYDPENEYLGHFKTVREAHAEVERHQEAL